MALIVLATERGTYWTGQPAAPWSDVADEAKTFATPVAAWRAAIGVQRRQGEDLAGSPLALHVRDPDDRGLGGDETAQAHCLRDRRVAGTKR